MHAPQSVSASLSCHKHDGMPPGSSSLPKVKTRSFDLGSLWFEVGGITGPELPSSSTQGTVPLLSRGLATQQSDPHSGGSMSQCPAPVRRWSVRRRGRGGAGRKAGEGKEEGMRGGGGRGGEEDE